MPKKKPEHKETKTDDDAIPTLNPSVPLVEPCQLEEKIPSRIYAHAGFTAGLFAPTLTRLATGTTFNPQKPFGLLDVAVNTLLALPLCGRNNALLPYLAAWAIGATLDFSISLYIAQSSCRP